MLQTMSVESSWSGTERRGFLGSQVGMVRNRHSSMCRRGGGGGEGALEKRCGGGHGHFVR